MRVELINYTPEPERTIAAAARLCYSDMHAGEIMQDLTEERVSSFLAKLVSMGHLSPFEHVSFTFAIEGVSRTLTHQLVRHRIASYSQKSQRYVSEEAFAYVIPPSVAANQDAVSVYEKAIKEIRAAYARLIDLVPREDARYILPNACETKIVCTFNARSLLHIFEQRCCTRAQWEIRDLAQKMSEEARKVAPVIFSEAGPPCRVRGICPEGEMSCGRLKHRSG